jgi:hypothetical protein
MLETNPTLVQPRFVSRKKSLGSGGEVSKVYLSATKVLTENPGLTGGVAEV